MILYLKRSCPLLHSALHNYDFNYEFFLYPSSKQLSFNGK